MSAPAARLVPVAAFAALVVAGCGSGEGDAGGEMPETSLEITVTGGGTDEHWTLTCDPAGGTHPDPEQACAALHKHADALAPTPPDTACTEQYGGPQEAVVEGHISGERYAGEFHRRDGCGIGRWEQLQPLLVVPGGV